MERSGFDRLRLAVNVTNLAASMVFIIGAAWALSVRSESWLGQLYSPLIKGFAWYDSLGLAGKAMAAPAGACALALVLVALMFSFKFKVENWAMMILGAPFYLLLAGTVFLSVSFIGSMIGWMLS